MVRRLRGTVEQEIAATQKLLAGSGPADPDVERAARTLASLVRTLRELDALNAAPAPSHEEQPRDLDDFRRELAARLNRLRAGSDEPSAGEPVAGGDGDFSR